MSLSLRIYILEKFLAGRQSESKGRFSSKKILPVLEGIYIGGEIGKKRVAVLNTNQKVLDGEAVIELRLRDKMT